MKRLIVMGAALAALVLPFTTTAQADGLSFETKLSGAQEVVTDSDGNLIPGGADTPASGQARARFDGALSHVAVDVRIRDLLGTFSAAHFHCGLPGQNGPVAFGLIGPGPLSFDGRRILGQLTNADYTGADCVPVVGRPVNNIAALALAMQEGLIYLNVHSSAFPAGEIRGQMLVEEMDFGGFLDRIHKPEGYLEDFRED